jgi:starch phosphorylase
VQLILAGKAHPADQAGQALIQEWILFARRPEVQPHVIFLSDYDMHLAERLVEGVDVWINTPRRPWEACGTSGMKVLVNGGINLSELDGWWAEAYRADVGWALGDGQENGDDPKQDAAEALALYDLLEREVIPEFYARDRQGIPTAWVARMRESMARLTPRFSASRAVREYTEKHYLPGAASYRQRAANQGAGGRQMVEWRRTSGEKWADLRFGEMKVETDGTQHVFEAQVCLNDFDPNAMRVELYADAVNGGEPVRQAMTRVRRLAGAASAYAYRVEVAATRPITDYTARAIPNCDGVAVPLEAAQIQWQR